MEIIIIAVAAMGLLFILGVSIETLLVWVTVILAVLSALSTVFFVVCCCMLLFSKKYPAQLCEIAPSKENSEDEQAAEKAMAKFAFYTVQGEKLRNWFPAEGIMRDRIYGKKECTVRVVRLGKRKVVFDRHSVVIVIAGTALMGLATFGLCAYWLVSVRFV